MRQQINLLPTERLGLSPALVAVLVWMAVLLAVGVAWGVNKLRLESARAVEAASARELAEAKSLLKFRAEQRTELEEQIKALGPLADSAEQFHGLVAGLGSQSGYLAVFDGVAGTVQEGLWLTRIDIGSGGKSIKVDGQSLTPDGVVRFSKGLNDAFEAQGVRFTAVEMTSQQASRAGAPGAVPISSTRFSIR